MNKQVMQTDNIAIIEYLPEHQPYFEQLNRSWIEKYFRIEPNDEYVLAQPEKAILDHSGYIFMAACNNHIAGTAGLKKVNDTTYEFTKMGVEETMRGKGLGDALCKAAIDKARSLGASRIILYSNTSLKPAIHLYRKLGFTEVPLETGKLERCNIKMELLLKEQITLITATPEHAELIAAIGRKSFLHTFENLFNKQEDLDHYVAATYGGQKIAAGISKTNNVFLIALHNNIPAGFAKIKRQSRHTVLSAEKQTELQKLYVLPEYHGRGTAPALMQEVMRLAQEIQPAYLWLDVLSSNARAIRFYEKNGFEKKGGHAFMIGSQLFGYDVMARPIHL